MCLRKVSTFKLASILSNKMFTLCSFDIFSTWFIGNECDLGCKCFKKRLNCSRIDFDHMHIFNIRITLSTETSLHRQMSELNPTEFYIDFWTKFEELDLTGKV